MEYDSPMIDLWTKHNPEFNPLEKLDHKHTLLNDPVFTHAYKWLFEQIGTDQVVWTYAKPDYVMTSHGYENKLWHLRVPEKEIITVVNDHHWNDVLMGQPSYTDEEYAAWEKNVPDDDKQWVEKYDEFLEEIKRNFKGIKNNWKKYVFEIDDIKKHQILIPSPIKPEWVVDCIHSSDYDTELIEQEITSVAFATQKERDHHVLVMRSLLQGARVEYTEEIKDHFRDDHSYCCRFDWVYPNSKE